MFFEEALQELRKGKKIRYPHFKKDVYLMGWYVTFATIIDDDGIEVVDTLEDAQARGMSIVKMEGDIQHSDMFTKNWPNPQPCCNPDLHSMPQLNLLSIMSDDWEVINDR